MKFDLHIHTHHSSCSNNKPETILKMAKKKGLDGIAITDHNTMKGADEVAKANKNKDFTVLKGEEVSTDHAHVLAINIQEEIKPGNIFNVLENIKDQGGLAIIAHPYGLPSLRSNLSIDIKEIKKKINAIETWNARMFFAFENAKAKTVAKQYNLPQTGGSDGHFWFEIGNAYTEFTGSLEKALKNRKTTPHGKLSYHGIGRGLSGLLKIVKR